MKNFLSGLLFRDTPVRDALCGLTELRKFPAYPELTPPGRLFQRETPDSLANWH